MVFNVKTAIVSQSMNAFAILMVLIAQNVTGSSDLWISTQRDFQIMNVIIALKYFAVNVRATCEVLRALNDHNTHVFQNLSLNLQNTPVE